MADTAGGNPGFWAMLFFGADIAARKTLRSQLNELKAINQEITDEYSLERLIEDIDDIQAEGAAAMGGLPDE